MERKMWKNRKRERKKLVHFILAVVDHWVRTECQMRYYHHCYKHRLLKNTTHIHRIRLINDIRMEACIHIFAAIFSDIGIHQFCAHKLFFCCAEILLLFPFASQIVLHMLYSFFMNARSLGIVILIFLVCFSFLSSFWRINSISIRMLKSESTNSLTSIKYAGSHWIGAIKKYQTSRIMEGIAPYWLSNRSCSSFFSFRATLALCSWSDFLSWENDFQADWLVKQLMKGKHTFREAYLSSRDSKRSCYVIWKSNWSSICRAWFIFDIPAHAPFSISWPNWNMYSKHFKVLQNALHFIRCALSFFDIFYRVWCTTKVRWKKSFDFDLFFPT